MTKVYSVNIIQPGIDNVIALIVIAMNVDLEAMVRDYENAVCKVIPDDNV